MEIIEFIIVVGGLANSISHLLFRLSALIFLVLAGIATLKNEKRDAKLLLLFAISFGILAR